MPHSALLRHVSRPQRQRCTGFSPKKQITSFKGHTDNLFSIPQSAGLNNEKEKVDYVDNDKKHKKPVEKKVRLLSMSTDLENNEVRNLERLSVSNKNTFFIQKNSEIKQKPSDKSSPDKGFPLKRIKKEAKQLKVSKLFKNQCTKSPLVSINKKTNTNEFNKEMMVTRNSFQIKT